MPAHRAQHAQASLPPIPLAGVLLTLLAIVTICLLAVTAAGSSIDPADRISTGAAPTVVITPDDPAAPMPVPVQELER